MFVVFIFPLVTVQNIIYNIVKLSSRMNEQMEVSIFLHQQFYRDHSLEGFNFDNY